MGDKRLRSCEDEAYPEEGGPGQRAPEIPLTLKVACHIRTYARSKRHFKDLLFKIGLGLCILLVIAPFFLILLEVSSTGLTVLLGGGDGEGLGFFTTYPGGGLKGGLAHAFIGTLSLAGVAGITGIPISVLGAVYINEYTDDGILRSSIEFAADVLAGIPSIVFGAFGLALIVDVLQFGKGVMAGGLTLAFMMVPTILRTTQESLKAVPMSLREASLALGATRWTTTWKVTVRSAFPGIVTGILLAFGRVIGETAPLIFTAGNSLRAPTELFGAGSWVASVPYTIYLYTIDPRSYLHPKAHAAALALMMIVLTIDLIANYISMKFTRRLG
ncbi:MAG: phosphate ABC transporter permease PstA [Candidatus Thorarchaeota archaeon]